MWARPNSKRNHHQSEPIILRYRRGSDRLDTAKPDSRPASSSPQQSPSHRRRRARKSLIAAQSPIPWCSSPCSPVAIASHLSPAKTLTPPLSLTVVDPDMEIPNQIGGGGGSVVIEIPATEIVGVDIEKPPGHQSLREWVSQLPPDHPLRYTCGLPNEVFLSMSFISFIYAVLAPWMLWRAADHQTLMWTSSILACSYGALWTVALSEQPVGSLSVLFRVSYVALVAFASTHLIGTINGISIVYLDTFYVAGMLGYAVAEYRLRRGTEECSSAIVANPPLDQEQERCREEGIDCMAFLCGLVSLCFVGRMAWLLFFPCGGNCLISSVIEELSLETLLLFYVWVAFVSLALLEEALVCVNTLFCKIPIYFGAWYVLGVPLGILVGDAIEMLIFWIGTMAMVGFFGYCFAVHAYCKRDQKTPA